ncbi:FAD-dependent oxidoreductase [Flammeovirga yaeyamensis]|uniref:FAD-dependent oxidoreductase n=1 Tax=Flammeovirga yaeyamensis TaxID=367791 RepID=A0AAX1N812_9BACT|nr:FAD-dependent oxidoreductase [Flammeovirga yaeyamensis]MBB3697945.1 protoporphyrinogen oxidase [Flammeovirga yaeyamensis]NMF35700.1 FAD-dependent oxidoreductase [Flammeovirga yaeyamensis]QWG03347.1 FAD-dependent oxidoreductase [Flammeovirga yaeyamensis]
MHRRHFLQLSSSALLYYLSGCSSSDDQLPFDITLRSDMERGHTLFQKKPYPQKDHLINTDTIIIGGGIAGLSAAFAMGEEDYHIFELSDRWGGTSSAEKYHQNYFAQGAHYDLSYPEKFGNEVIQTLEQLNIIHKEGEVYHFKDKEYVIPQKDLMLCKYGNQYYNYVLFNEEEATQFYQFLHQFDDKITLPSRLNEASIQDLNHITFKDWLIQQGMEFSDVFWDGINYHMLDDYGTTIDEVSALAGISYYCNRPHEDEWADVFSPPQGNAYFVDKFEQAIPKQKKHLNHICRSISFDERNNQFKIELIDFEKNEVQNVIANKVIYAAPKHTLKFTFSEVLNKTDYLMQTSGWVVVNLVFKEGVEFLGGLWQNENLETFDGEYLGFVDNITQNKEGNRMLTAYYCFAHQQKEKLVDIQKTPNLLVRYTLEKIASFLDLKTTDITPKIEQSFVHLMGHAMPKVGVGYLGTDLNIDRKYKNFVFAGVDNGRLPFLVEAIDSGIVAVQELKS